MYSGKTFVRFALNIGAIELVPEGRKLKSGRMSPYFFNSGLFNKGAHTNELARAYIGAFIEMNPKMQADVIFGPAYKGIPLAVAMSMKLNQKYNMNVGWAFNRKEAKDHGEGGIIVGHSVDHKNVIITDDVMTTGTSSGEAVTIVRVNGGIPVGCVIAFDRQERGTESDISAVQEFSKNYKVPVRAAATLVDLIEVLEEEKRNEALEKVLEYQKQYGAEY